MLGELSTLYLGYVLSLTGRLRNYHIVPESVPSIRSVLETNTSMGDRATYACSCTSKIKIGYLEFFTSVASAEIRVKLVVNPKSPPK